MGKAVRKVPDFVGRPSFKVTKEVLQRVEELAATGMPQVWIAKGLGINEKTLVSKRKEVQEFSEAYERGRSKALEKLYNGAMTNATTPTKAAPGGMLEAQFGLIDRIEGRPQKVQVSGDAQNPIPVTIILPDNKRVIDAE